MSERTDTVDRLAALIRRIDGNHDHGASDLAECLVSAGVEYPEPESRLPEGTAYLVDKAGDFWIRVDDGWTWGNSLEAAKERRHSTASLDHLIADYGPVTAYGGAPVNLGTIG